MKRATKKKATKPVPKKPHPEAAQKFAEDAVSLWYALCPEEYDGLSAEGLSLLTKAVRDIYIEQVQS